MEPQRNDRLQPEPHTLEAPQGGGLWSRILSLSAIGVLGTLLLNASYTFKGDGKVAREARFGHLSGQLGAKGFGQHHYMPESPDEARSIYNRYLADSSKYPYIDVDTANLLVQMSNLGNPPEDSPKNIDRKRGHRFQRNRGANN